MCSSLDGKGGANFKYFMYCARWLIHNNTSWFINNKRSTVTAKVQVQYFSKTVKVWSQQNAPTKHSLIIDVLDAEPEACWECADQDVEIEEEWDPCRRLVLWHWRYYGDVDLCIAGDGGRVKAGGRDRQDVIHVGLSVLGGLRQIIQYYLLINSRIMSKKDNLPPQHAYGKLWINLALLISNVRFFAVSFWSVFPLYSLWAFTQQFWYDFKCFSLKCFVITAGKEKTQHRKELESASKGKKKHPILLQSAIRGVNWLGVLKYQTHCSAFAEHRVPGAIWK